MRWVPFQEKKPSDKHQLITRKSREGGDLLEEWPEWLDCCQKDAHTHWWDGDYDFKLATVYWSLFYHKAG